MTTLFGGAGETDGDGLGDGDGDGLGEGDGVGVGLLAAAVPFTVKLSTLPVPPVPTVVPLIAVVELSTSLI